MSRLEKLWEPQSILFNFEKKRMHYPHHVQRKATMWEMSSLLVWSMQSLYSHDYPKCIGWLISFQSSWKVILKSCLLQFKKGWLITCRSVLHEDTTMWQSAILPYLSVTAKVHFVIFLTNVAFAGTRVCVVWPSSAEVFLKEDRELDQASGGIGSLVLSQRLCLSMWVSVTLCWEPVGERMLKCKSFHSSASLWVTFILNSNLINSG